MGGRPSHIRVASNQPIWDEFDGFDGFGDKQKNMKQIWEKSIFSRISFYIPARNVLFSALCEWNCIGLIPNRITHVPDKFN